MDESDPTTNGARQARKELDVSDTSVHLPRLEIHDLPKCPTCDKGLLRPGVVWFGESLPHKVISTVEDFIADSPKIDLILVIGTSARVYPAAGYVDRAREKGARVAVINMDQSDAPASGLTEKDWFFHGDAAQIVPELLRSVVGDIQ